MEIEIIALLITVLLAWSGLLIGIIKTLLDRNQAHIDKRFSTLEKANEEEARDWQRIERELLELKADLPMEYVRREDAIRQEVVINAKLDALAEKMEIWGRRGT